MSVVISTSWHTLWIGWCIVAVALIAVFGALLEHLFVKERRNKK